MESEPARRRPPLEAEWASNRCGSGPPLSANLSVEHLDRHFVYGASTGAASGPRSKRVRGESLGDRHVVAPPFLTQALRECSGLISLKSVVRLHGLLPTSESANKDGWCRRPPVKRIPEGRRFDSVHSPPCGRSSMVEHRVANAKTPDRYRSAAPIRSES